MKKILWVWILILLGASPPAARPSGLQTADQMAVRAARLRQNAAIVARNLDEIAAYWTSDVTICRGLGVQLAGKAAYRTLFAADTGSPSDIVYVREPNSVDVAANWPLAFETGIWKGHLGGPQGPIVISGKYSAQWVKRGGQWLIRAEVFVALQGSGSGASLTAAP
jgi:ketosteroid isomerase-like protein